MWSGFEFEKPETLPEYSKKEFFSTVKAADFEVARHLAKTSQIITYIPQGCPESPAILPKHCSFGFEIHTNETVKFCQSRQPWVFETIKNKIFSRREIRQWPPNGAQYFEWSRLNFCNWNCNLLFSHLKKGLDLIPVYSIFYKYI